MAKKCKNCGAVVEDAAKICANCSNLGFEEIARVELSQDQIQEIAKTVAENLSKKPRVLWGVTWRVILGVFVILGIPGAITGWNIWSSLHGFEQSTTAKIESNFKILNQNSSNQIVKAYSDITNDVSAKFELFAQEASNKIVSAYSSVTNQIADEFQTPKIKQTVDMVARGEAKTILEEEVQPAVKSFKEDALFIRTVARAQAYDFRAYRRLLEIGTQTNEDAKLANQVVAEIDRALERNRSDILGKRSYIWFVGTNLYKGPFTSDELATDFPFLERDRTSLNREAFVNAILDLHQPLFLPALVEFFTNETDLAVGDRLTLAISDLAKKDFHPHDFEQIQTWWRSHENEYTNWPFSEYGHGFDEFSHGNFAVAANLFQQVLKLDPSADMSRAFAIHSCLVIGETNKAAELAKEFKDPAARWAKWASAITELQTGSASNATVQFVNLTKNDPTMTILPKEGVLRWRKIDWQLFHKLTSTEKPSP
jgi:hypothetical protein